MLPPAVQLLLAEQAGVITRRQALSRGLLSSDIERLLRRREWVVVHPGTYVDHTGPLTWSQRAWAAVLCCGRSALCGVSALRAAEGPGRRARDWDLLHVAVDRHRHIASPTGVRVHRMEGLRERAAWSLGPPRLRYDEAVLDVAIEEGSRLDAIGVLAGACGARRTTARRLLTSLDRRARVPRRDWLSTVLTDISEGTCSVLEHGYLTDVERPHGLPKGRRQARATASVGVVYRDVDYAALVVELDGRLFHDSAEQRDRDLERDLDTALDGRTTVRLGYGQVFGRPCGTAAKVARMLEQRGWRGRARSCGASCVLPVG